MSLSKLVKCIEAHNHKVISFTDAEIIVLEEYSNRPAQVVSPAPAYKVVREWLGY